MLWPETVRLWKIAIRDRASVDVEAAYDLGRDLL
jgi:hypothetical protein